MNSLFYVASDNSTEVDELIDEFNPKEGRNIGARDFMGHDFTAWVYDLLRPKEAYQERGIHPSGEGFDRYIKFADLTSDDRIFLRRQAQLQRLNLSMVHMLTSSGYTVDTHLFLQCNQLIDYPLNWNKNRFLATSELGVWTQPKEQNFYTNQAVLGGLFGLTVYQLDQ